MSSPTLNALVHTMRYEADGIVSKVHVEPGQTVAAGQLLVEM